MSPPGTPPRRVLYGRRKGRPLRPGRRDHLARVMPRLEIALPEDGARIDPAALFDRPVAEVWLEIGFGAGEHLLAQAAAHPDVGFIGCEPYIAGVARLIGGLEDQGLDNVRILRDDARLLLDRLADRCLARVFVLFPDPWPKTRHHKRRIVCRPVLAALARTMVAGGELRIATDDAGYLVWILEHVRSSGAFAWCAEGPADWRARPADWPATRFEAKAIAAGRRCTYLRYKRLEARFVGGGAEK